jgi:alpha-L-fucosidase
MKNKNILKGFLFTILFLGTLFSCDPNSRIPSYLKDYKKEYHENPREANLKWFKDAGFGLFIHYGLYSLLAKGEWIQLRDTIPVAEYARLKDKFTAENFNADEIARLAGDAGMRYITITSKHHDGFCLFSTEETTFNSVKSSAERDLIQELYQACEKYELGLFLYYSYGADWRHPYFYSRENGWVNARPAYNDIQPEYKFEKDEDFNIYVRFVHNQLKEILIQYPDIAGIWFDPIMGYYSRPDLFPIDSTYSLVRSLSPHALVSFKQGANGDEDFMAPERSGNAKVGQQYEVARRVYEKNKDKPREICNTLQPHAWGYDKRNDGKHKTAEEVIQMLEEAEKLNANLLLNIGPKGDGSIPEEDRITLKEVGEKLKSPKNPVK